MERSMTTQRIARDEWIQFSNELNKTNRDKKVRIIIRDDNKKEKDRAESIEFEGIEVSSKDQYNTIVQVTAGNDLSFTHFIDQVEDISVSGENPDNIRTVHISSSLGRSAEIYFPSMDE